MCGGLSPRRWQKGDGIAEDFKDGGAIFQCEPRELRVVICTGEDGQQFFQKQIPHWWRKFREGLALDQKAAGVFEKTGLKIEVSKRTAFGIARANLCKSVCVSGM